MSSGAINRPRGTADGGRERLEAVKPPSEVEPEDSDRLAAELEALSAESTATRERLTARIASLELELKDASQGRAKLTDELRVKQQALSNERERLRSERQARAKEAAELRAKREEIRAARAEIATVRGELSERDSTSGDQAREAQEERTQLESTVEALTAERDDLSRRLARRRKDVEELTPKLANSEETVARLTRELEQLADRHRQQLEDTDAGLKRIEAEHRATVEARSAEHAATLEQLRSERRLERIRLESERQTLAADNVQLVHRLDSSDQVVRTLGEAIEHLRAETAALRSERAELLGRLDTLSFHHEGLGRSLADRDVVVSEHVRTEDALRAKLKEEETESDRRRARVRTLEAEVARRDALLAETEVERETVLEDLRRVAASRAWRWGHGTSIVLRRLAFRPTMRRAGAVEKLIDRLDRPPALEAGEPQAAVEEDGGK